MSRCNSDVTNPCTMYSSFSKEQLERLFLKTNWGNLDEQKRQDLLQEVVNRECNALGNKFNCIVSFENLPTDVFGEQRGLNKIALNREAFVFDHEYIEYNGRNIEHMIPDSNYRAFETVQHEFRHVYQNMVSNGIVESDPYTKMVYESNNYTVTDINGLDGSQYLEGYTGYEFYYLNPTELDAYKISQIKTKDLVDSLENKFGTDGSMTLYREYIKSNGYDVELQKCREYFNDQNVDKSVENILVSKYYNIPCENVDKNLELMVEKEMIITQYHLTNPNMYLKGSEQMSDRVNFSDLHVSREQMDSALRDSVNHTYEHLINNPSLSHEEAIAEAQAMAERYHISMEEFDAQAEQADMESQMQNHSESELSSETNQGLDSSNGMDSGSAGMEADGGMGVE